MFRDQIHNVLISLLLHLSDPSPDVVKVSGERHAVRQTNQLHFRHRIFLSTVQIPYLPFFFFILAVFFRVFLQDFCVTVRL